MSFVVYTAITDGYDQLREVPANICAGARFVAFLESPHSSTTWDVRELPRHHPESTRNAKFPKLLPHRLFPDADMTLWVDGSIELIMPFGVNRLVDFLRDVDLAIFRHPTRMCIYQEANVCLQAKLDKRQLIIDQIARYTRDGFPANAGLVEASVLLRRHTKPIQLFNEAWWNEIEAGSHRDQLSFNYVAWKQRLRYECFPDTPVDNSLFAKHRHAVSRRRVIP